LSLHRRRNSAKVGSTSQPWSPNSLASTWCKACWVAGSKHMNISNELICASHNPSEQLLISANAYRIDSPSEFRSWLLLDPRDLSHTQHR
jgi:hypothetical protein